MAPSLAARIVPLPARAAGGVVWLVSLLTAGAPVAAQTTIERLDTDRIDITGRQNLTLGSGARAYGMGGAFLARADDATAASWNPAGLSYLRVPEVSLVGAFNSFLINRGPQQRGPQDERGPESDEFNGRTIDFGAFTWPVGLGEVRGAVQLSYQRAISFDGSRRIDTYDEASGVLTQIEEGRPDGGFDVLAFGTGLRLSRRVRAGFTVNRWLNGYDQTLSRTYYQGGGQRPLREFDLDLRLRGWSFNFGLMASPIDQVNLAAVYKTPFTADVRLDKARRDSWGTIESINEVTTNAFSSEAVRLEFPSSFGFGVSWRPRDTLTLSADFTRTSWSEARIDDYFDLGATGRTEDGVPAIPPPPTVYGLRQYPTLLAVPDPDDPDDPARLLGQQDAEQFRVGIEWVVIKGQLKIPLRAGYFNDRQITPNAVSGPSVGAPPRFNGFTAGTGIILGPMLIDVAYIYEFGEYFLNRDAASGGQFDVPPTSDPDLVRNTLTTKRFFVSMIYRFRGRWLP